MNPSNSKCQKDYVEIPIGGKGHLVALVDEADAPKVLKYKWTIHYSRQTDSPYARRNIRLENGRYRTVAMHRLILVAPEGYVVDHINRTTLDNRRSNLRLATRSQNQINQKRPNTGKSPYRGVSRIVINKKWVAYIHSPGRHSYLGQYDNPVDAAIAYDMAALMFHGEFAQTNILIPTQ